MSKKGGEEREIAALFLVEKVVRATDRMAIHRTFAGKSSSLEQDFFFCLWCGFLETAMLVFKNMLFKTQMFGHILVQKSASKDMKT